MTLKKIITLTFVPAILLGCLAGCSKNGDTGNESMVMNFKEMVSLSCLNFKNKIGVKTPCYRDYICFHIDKYLQSLIFFLLIT